MPISLVFLGSFQHYSAILLEALLANARVQVVGVVTTGPALNSRTKEWQKNPVQTLAERQGVPVAAPVQANEASLTEVVEELGLTEPPDLFLTAGYGKLLPPSWLEYPKLAALNLHFSLLPKYRGANPGEWALLLGETTTGVTLIEMSPQFDTGQIIAKQALAIAPEETRHNLYEKLYVLGGEMLPEALAAYAQFVADGIVLSPSNPALSLSLPPEPQPPETPFYARRLNRDDGFVAWKTIAHALAGEYVPVDAWPALLQEAYQTSPEPQPSSLAVFLERATRALAGYPGLWTEVQTNKGLTRMKVLQSRVQPTATGDQLFLETVQLAGKQPAPWGEVKNSLVAASQIS